MEKEPVISCAELRDFVRRNTFGKYLELEKLVGFIDHKEKTWKIACQLEGIKNNEDARCAKCGLPTKGQEVAVTKRGIVHLKCLG